MTIHTFVDASKDAPGVVCLARSACEDGTVETQLIASRTKVTPLAAMCTPRLQLSAAVLYRVAADSSWFENEAQSALQQFG